jgi:hypothetical protein
LKVVGRVYRVHTILTKPPKEKIVLYVGSDYFLWFNTDARQRPGQMKVDAKECPEIIHTSYLDCGRVTMFSDTELKAAKPCGDASIDFMGRVLEEIQERATVMVTAHRKQIADNLLQCYPDLIKDEE